MAFGVDDAIAVIIIGSTVLGMGNTIYQTYKSNTLAGNATQLQIIVAGLNNEADELTKEINSNSALRSKLIDAYNQADTSLANSLLYASPFSSYYKNLVKERKNLTKAFNDKNAAILDKEVEKLNEQTSIRNRAAKVSALYSRVAGGSLSDSKKALAEAETEAGISASDLSENTTDGKGSSGAESSNQGRGNGNQKPRVRTTWTESDKIQSEQKREELGQKFREFGQKVGDAFKHPIQTIQSLIDGGKK